MRRPADIKEDMKHMEAHKRVSLILNSQAFREELDAIISETIRAGPHPASLLALQQISDLILPQARSSSGAGLRGTGGSTVIPIADIRGVDSLNYSKGEKILRCKLAACYRLADLAGWSHGIYNHITARISQDYEHFLINPFGLMYHEVTASSLAKVDMQGNIVDPGTTNFGINKAGFAVHAAIHAARPDIKAIIHVHTDAAVAVSSMKCGFLPISQEAMLCGEPSYYDYSGILVDQEERDQVARALGPSNKLIILRNHGVLACGESIEEAFQFAYNCTIACETQIKVAPIGLDNIVIPSVEIQKKTYEAATQAAQGQLMSDGKRKWRRGEMEYEALMRHLDNAGFRTGHIYREPLVKGGSRAKERQASDVEVPPSSSSFTYFYDDESDLSKYTSPLKQHLEKQKKHFKSEWLASPNVYKREEIEETGTPNPKKITKWVQEGGSSPTTSTPIKVEHPNQFAPQGADPKELRDKHKMIRKDYYEEKVTAGPQSKILEGITWEEAQRIKDGHVSGTSDSVIVVGAASKGIIQREHQHNAVVYKTYYAANPFENMTEDEVEKYKQEIERKKTGSEPPEEELQPGPDGKLISTDERLEQVRHQQELEVTPQVVEELKSTLSRSKSEGRPKKSRSATETAINGDEGYPTGSPAKSTSSADEGSPTKEVPAQHESPSKGEKKKKKFRMPSFSKKKDKK